MGRRDGGGKSLDFVRGRRGHELSNAERAALDRALSGRVELAARQTIVRRGEPVEHSTLLLSGFMCRYMDARDGFRQLVSVHIAGDFIDLHGYPLQRLDHDLATLTDCVVATVSHEQLTELVATYPNLGRLMWFATLLDAAMHREWIFRLGRLEAMGRVAHLLCETYTRLEAVDRAANYRFDFPLTQQDLGEACGLTSVHINRTVRRLREAGLAEVTNREVRILDFPALAAEGEFNSDYLYLDTDSSTRGLKIDLTRGERPRPLVASPTISRRAHPSTV